jgi:hypothetical protein
MTERTTRRVEKHDAEVQLVLNAQLSAQLLYGG